MVKLEDVAKKAGVSRMTVSRVVNNPESVSPALREKVQDAIKILGYMPNLTARSLALGKSNIIAYIIPDISDPYFDLVFKAAESTGKAGGYTVVFLSSRNGKEFFETIELVIRLSISGVIIHDLYPSDEILKILRDNGIEYVLVDNETERDDGLTIEIDHYWNSAMLAEHICKNEYDSIFCVHGPLGARPEYDEKKSRRYYQRRLWKERTAGFTDEIRNNGKTVTLVEAEQFDGFITYESGRRAAEKILKGLTGTAVVYCEDDVMALGFSGYLEERGYKPGEQVSIFGNDGLVMSTTLYPRISCLCHPREQIGKEAISMIMDRIKGNMEPQKKILRGSLFIGDTGK